MKFTSRLQQGFGGAANRSAKPPSPGSNPGVAFVNIPLFPVSQAPSSLEERILRLFHFRSNPVESTHNFRHKFSPSFSYHLKSEKSCSVGYCVCVRLKLGDIYKKQSLKNFGVNFYGY